MISASAERSGAAAPARGSAGHRPSPWRGISETEPRVTVGPAWPFGCLALLSPGAGRDSFSVVSEASFCLQFGHMSEHTRPDSAETDSGFQGDF